MQFRVLGPLRFTVDGVEKKLPAAKQRMLLGVLLINANRVVTTDRLLEDVWGDHQPASGVRTLRYHISKLRSSLGRVGCRSTDASIATEPGGYALTVSRRRIDSCRFEMLAGDGQRGMDESRFHEARRVLGEALGLWRGGAFDDFRYEEFAQGEIARLEELRLTCLENRIQADIDLNAHREVVGELKELTTNFPMREGLWAQLMMALSRSERQGEALQVYRDASRILGEEFGIGPSSTLRRLRMRIALDESPTNDDRPSLKYGAVPL